MCVPVVLVCGYLCDCYVCVYCAQCIEAGDICTGVVVSRAIIISLLSSKLNWK